MFELLQKMYANDVELKIDKAPVIGSVMKFSMRSGHFCLVRYFNCDDYILGAAQDSMIVKALHIMLDEFLKEQERREEMAKRIVEGGIKDHRSPIPPLCTTDFDWVYTDEMCDNLRQATCQRWNR